MAEIPGEFGNSSKSASVSVDAASLGDNTLITCPAGSTIRVFQMFIVLGGAANVTFKSGATSLTGALPMLSNGDITLDYSGFPWFTTARDEDFVMNLSAAVQVSGRIYYTTT